MTHPNFISGSGLYWCGDPACQVCCPVKLIPQPPVTHGWDGLDDEPYLAFGHPDGKGGLEVRVIDKQEQTAGYRGPEADRIWVDEQCLIRGDGTFLPDGRWVPA